MRRPYLKKTGNSIKVVDDTRLQEKLVERYFQNLDLNAVEPGAYDAEFNRERIYEGITAVIDADNTMPAKRGYGKWLAAASVIGILILFSWIYRLDILNYVSPVNYLEVSAANGNVTHIKLSDGTNIWLNSGSKLAYPETFRGDHREITLTGEGFFDVVHNADMPFIVHTGDITTHVLGTSFNIRAYANEKLVKIDVASGKVGVVPTENSNVDFGTVYLTPSQGVAFNKGTHSITKSTGVDIASISSWSKGKLVFKNSPLPEVIKSLSRKFNCNITADNNLSSCYVSADFTNVPLKDIVAVIAKLVKGKAEATGTNYHLKGKGC
ncbi:FecR family protein [Mucilaginibacter limnophilus]|nr:FecR domain-containing protein [Mucilaginibacter limnophilus]